MINLSSITIYSCPDCPQKVQEDHSKTVKLALEHLYSHSSTAKSLIHELNKSKYPIAIIPHTGSEKCPYQNELYKPEKDLCYGTIASSASDSTSGKGTNGFIIFPPYAVSPLVIKDVTERVTFYPSKARVLAHELIHALHISKGCNKAELKSENS